MPASLANTRRSLASSGVRLNAFGQPFTGSKIQGVQRKTYMGGSNQGPLSSRQTQATGTRGVEIEMARLDEQAMANAAARGAERARAERSKETTKEPLVTLKSTQIPARTAKNEAPKKATAEAGMKRGMALVNEALPKGMTPIKPKTAIGAELRDMRRKQGGLMMRSPKARSYAI